MKIVRKMIVVVILFIAIFIFAVTEEFKDARKLLTRPKMMDLKTGKERLHELQFHAFYHGLYKVYWRQYFIVSSVVTGILYLWLRSCGIKLEMKNILIIFFTMFFVQFMYNNYMAYHVDRYMMVKINPTLFDEKQVYG